MGDLNEAKELLQRAEAKIDAILRGQHAGWDQALHALRKELLEALQ
jgi:hypothetical protein